MTGTSCSIGSRIDRDGFAIIADAIRADWIDRVLSALDRADDDAGRRAKSNQVYAIRNLLRQVPEVAELARSAQVRALVDPIAGTEARVARAIFFDKTPEANWKVAWHQDLSIAVKQRIEAEGYGPWSLKAGVHHVQPPVQVLRQMLAVRIHLDDCLEENGPLLVLPGSHAHGILTSADIAQWRRDVPSVACCVGRGGAVLMRPLLLHASSAATKPGHRRVIHLECAAGTLPGGLEWEQT